MSMFFFDVTVKVIENEVPVRSVLYCGARARDELSARRIVLYQYLDRGLQVVRIDRAPERTLSKG